MLGAAGVKPRVGGRDLERELVDAQRANGSFEGRVNTTAFAILALRAVGHGARDPVMRRGVAYIAGQANDDGGFNFAGRGGPSGIDDTGAVLQALAAAGRGRGRAAKRAARFIVRNQASDGGFALIPGGPSNAQSTAWAVQGLLAAGRDPAKVRRNGSRDPMSYLRSLTASSGEVRYSRTSRQTPVWVTGQVLAALSRKTLPLARVPRARRAAPRRRPPPRPPRRPPRRPRPPRRAAAEPQSLPPVQAGPGRAAGRRSPPPPGSRPRGSCSRR